MASPKPMDNPRDIGPHDLMSLVQSLELWSEKYNVPALSGVIPTTVDDVCLHLAFLGTRIRGLYTLSMYMSWSGELEGEGQKIEQIGKLEQQMVHDSRVACLVLVTACGQLASEKKGELMLWLEALLQKQVGQTATVTGTGTGTNTSDVGSSGEAASLSSPGSHSTATYNTGHPESGSAAHIDKTQSRPSKAAKILPNDKIIAGFPAVAILVLARKIMGEPVSMSLRASEEPEDLR